MRGVVLGQRTYYALNQPAPLPGIEDKVLPTSVAPQEPVNRSWNRITGISRYVSAHIFHNLISSVAIFPTSLQLDSLEKVIKTPHSFWSADWTGDLPPGQMGLLWINLIVIALGVAASWSRRRWAGLVPAGFLVAYCMATAAARTSGGRYILPADWVVMFYFAIGIAQIYFWVGVWLSARKSELYLEQGDKDPHETLSGWRMTGLALIFLVIGAIPVVLNRVIPQHFSPVDKSTFAGELDDQSLFSTLGLSEVEMGTFLQLPGAVVYNGRGLYPRFYAMNQGEPDRFSVARGQPFPRLVLTIIGPHKQVSGVLPMLKSPEVLPNGVDVLAIGCKGELNDDWLALVVNSPERQVFLRNPATQWACPVTPPVCDDNRNCR